MTQLGAGWSVYNSDAYDTAGVSSATTFSTSSSWVNTEKTHIIGDQMSSNMSATLPVGPVVAGMVLTYDSKTGLLDPFATDDDGNPSPINIPSSSSQTLGYVLGYSISAYLTLQYVAERKRTERVIFLVRADTQPVLVDPLLSQDSETITKSGADVGVPIINLLDWTSIAGTFMDLGQIVFPDNPNIPGGQSVQICVQAGTAGTVEPAFSDIPGVTTADGGIIWSSLGAATPPDNAVDWTAISHVNAGAVILPKKPFYVPYSALIQSATDPGGSPNAIPVAEGQIVQAANGSFQVCTLGGNTDPRIRLPPFSTTWGVVTTAGSSQWTSLGMKLPSGTTYHLATTAGTSGALWLIPPFNEGLHQQTNDNGVVWTCIGSGDIPVGGVPGDTWSPTYFATDRGQSSLQYLAALVRAKLLYRARCVEISFDCDYGRGVGLTARKTVTLHDPRIAGGTALGKIKSAVLSVSDSGIAGCQVTIACTAGYGNAVDEQPGDPTYVDAGYVDDWQQYDNVTVVLPTTTDLSYAPIVYGAADDGLTFPLTREMVVVVDKFHQGEQGIAQAALTSMAVQARLLPVVSAGGAVARQSQLLMLGANSLDNLLKLNPSWQEFQFKPVNAGPFNKVYNVKFSDLQVPQGIDLQSDTIT